MSRILIDADGCPVVEETVAVAQAFQVEVIIVCDTSHFFSFEGIETIVCDKGKDSVDFEILQKALKNDIVVTQDYGLAALLLSKSVYPISQNGLRYTSENIDALLQQRNMSAMLRKHKHRVGNMKKRTAQENDVFMDALEELLEELLE